MYWLLIVMSTLPPTSAFTQLVHRLVQEEAGEATHLQLRVRLLLPLQRQLALLLLALPAQRLLVAQHAGQRVGRLRLLKRCALFVFCLLVW